MTEQQIKDFLETKEVQAVLLLVAWTILKTKTVKDDQVLDVISEYTDLLAAELKKIAEAQPTDDDAKDAGIILLQKVASETETTWDDFVVNILKRIV